MSYKTILVHADLSPHAINRIRLAARLAHTQRGHLTGIAVCSFPSDFYRAAATLYVAPPAAEFARLNHQSSEALDRFETLAHAFDLPQVDARVCQGDSRDVLVREARHADLVVLSQNDPDAAPGAVDDLPEQVLLHGGRPVLLVPYAGKFERLDHHALVAWDGSEAAARAITGAVPLLRRSAAVTLAVLNPQQHGGEEMPGEEMVRHLACHGVRSEVLAQRVPEGLDVGGALLSIASDLCADLMVMGAYGHRRRRELLLGGVTRTCLRSMTVPVLMSH